MTQAPTPTTSPAHRKPTRVLVRIAMCVVLAGAFTAAQIRRSMATGRLASLPQYDDVTYMLQGLARERVLREDGPIAFVRNMVESPLWSPWGSLGATLGYAALGMREWAPYAVNGLLLLALLLLIDRAMRGASIAVKLVCWMLALAIPLSAHAIADFRPDFATAFATAAAMLCILRIRATVSARRAAALAGAVAAAALLAKPTVFAATVVYLGGSGVIMVTRELLRLRSASRADGSIKHLAVNVGVCAGAAMILIAPQYALQHKAYWYYFKINTFGDRAALWDRGLSGLENVGYFLTGPAGELMFGPMLIPLMAVAIGGTVFALTRKERDTGWRLVQLWIAAVGCLTLPSMNATKNPYFGLVFGTLVLFIAVIGLREVFGALAARSGRWATGTALGCTALLTLAAGINHPATTPGDAFNPTSQPGFDAAASDGTAETLADAVVAAVEAARGRQAPVLGEAFPTVHFTGSGYMNQHTMSYLLMRRGYPRWTTTDSAAIDDRVRLARGVAMADVVVAFEPGFADERGQSLMHDRFPGNRVLDISLGFAAADGGLIEAARVPSPAGPAAIVFARLGRTSLNPRAMGGEEASDAASGPEQSPGD